MFSGKSTSDGDKKRLLHLLLNHATAHLFPRAGKERPLCSTSSPEVEDAPLPGTLRISAVGATSQGHWKQQQTPRFGFAKYPGGTLQMRPSLEETILRLLGFQKVVYDWVFTCVSKVHSALGFSFRSSGGYQRNNSFCVLSLGWFPREALPSVVPSKHLSQTGVQEQVLSHFPMFLIIRLR